MKHLLLKSWLVLVCLLMGAGTSWAKEVTVTLTDGGSDSDSNSKIANSNANIDAQKYSVDVDNFVNSIVAGNTYVYQAKTDCGWKFGNSSNPGKITINLKNAVEIASVTVTAKNASSKVADIKIGGGTAQALTSDFSDYTQNYTSGNSTSSIVIETVLHTNGGRRAYITSIVIATVDGDGGDTPTPTALSAPSNLQSSNITTTGAALSWDAVEHASSYTVKIGETEHTGLKTNSYSATGLTAGTQYTWTVKAVGDGTNYTTSAYAANANFTTENEQGGGDDPAPTPVENGLITVWSEDFSTVTFPSGQTTQQDLSKITSATFAITAVGGTTCAVYKNDNMAAGTAPELLLPKRAGSGSKATPCVLSVTINDLKGCYGDMVLTLKSNAALAATTFSVGTTTNNVTVTKGENTQIWTVSVPKGTNSLVLTFTNSGTSNYRLDDLLLSCPGQKVTISEAGYATYFNADHAYVMPGDCEGYAFTAANGLTRVYDAEAVVPAGEPLVIYTIEPGTKTLVFTTSEEDSYKEQGLNDLQGASTDMTAAEMADANPGMGKFYALSLNAEGKEVGFYWINEGGAAFIISAGKAYLALPTGYSAPARFIFGQQGVPTELQNVSAEIVSRKVMIDGCLYILRDGKTYDSLGRMVK